MSERSVHNLYDLSRPALGSLLSDWGYSDYHADIVWRYLYGRRVTSLAEMSELRTDLAQKLRRHTTLQPLACVMEQESRDGTRKALLRLPDAQMIETVLMPYRDRYTACVSTQAGCAMGCVFCATGQMGFARHLSAGEIVAQVLYAHGAADEDEGRHLRNVVFMGMGEPLHNYEATMTAIDILCEDTGLAIGPSYITLSTVGVVPGIRRLAEEDRPINLAVSLHGATDEERNALVPVGRKWNLHALMEACRHYCRRRERRIFFEWTLIEGQNDTPQQAHALGHLLQGLEAHVNLIPLNPTGDYAGRPSQSGAVRRFREILDEYELPSTVRQRRGIDIDAGCGQLRQRVVPTSASP